MSQETRKNVKEKMLKLWNDWLNAEKNKKRCAYILVEYSICKIKEHVSIWDDLGFRFENDFKDSICNILHISWMRLEMMVARFSKDEYTKYPNNILFSILTHVSPEKQNVCFEELEKNKFRTVVDKVKFVREWGEKHCPEILHEVQDRTIRRDDDTQKYRELEAKYLKMLRFIQHLFGLNWEKSYDKIMGEKDSVKIEA